MLQKSSDDRPDADILRQPFDAGPQDADPADDQVDLDARLRRRVKLVDQLDVGHAVEL